MIQNSPFKNDLFFKQTIATVVVDELYNIVDVNINFTKLIGYSKKELLGKNIGEFTKKEYFEVEIDKINSLLKGEINEYTIQRKYIHKNGNIIKIEADVSLFNFKKTIYFIARVKLIDYFRKDDYDLLKTIVEKSPIVQYIIDVSKDKIIFENTNLLKYLGYEKNDFGKLNESEFLFSILDDENKKNFLNGQLEFAKNFSLNKFTKVFFSVDSKDKEKKCFKLKTIPLKIDDKGNKLFTFGMIEDITERTHNSNKIKQQKELIKNISKSIPQFIYLIDVTAYNFLYSNNKCIDLLGYTDSEFENINKSKLYDKQFKKIIAKYRDERLSSKIKNSFEVDVKLKHKTKGYRWYRLNSNVFERNEKNEIIKIIESISDINDLKTSQEEIQFQKDFIKEVTDELPSYIYVYNHKTKKLKFSNFKTNEIFGYSYTDYIKNIRKIAHPDYLERAILMSKKLLDKKHKKYLSIEVLLRPKNKDYRWYRIKTKVLKRDIDGSPLQILEIIDDIHDEKNKTKKIIKQELLLKNITNSIPEYIYLADIQNYKPLFSNNKSKKVLGYSENEYYKLNPKLFVKESSVLTINNIYNKVRSSKTLKKAECEVQLLHKTKGYRWYRHRIVVFERDENKKPIHLLKIIEDIHEAKLNEILRIDYQDFVAKIASISPNLILVTELKNDKVIYTNFERKRFLGYNEEEWIKKNKNIIHPDFKDEYFNKFKELVNTNNSVNDFYLELKVINKFNNYVWIAIKTKIFKEDKKGKPTHIMSTISYIDKNKKAFETVLQQKKIIDGIANSIPQYLSLWDIEKSECIYTNFENTPILGHTKEEYIKNGENYIHSDFKNMPKEIGDKIYTNKTTNEIDTTFKIKNSKNKYVWVKLKVLIIKRNDQGKAIHSLEILEDINEQKIADNTIKKQQNFITKVNDTMPNILIVYDIDLKKYIYTNLQKINFLGYSEKNLRTYSYKNIHKDDIERYKRIYKKFILTKNAKLINNEFRIKTNFNKYKWVLMTSVPFILNENGYTTQIMTSYTDIDKQKRLFIELEEQLIKNIELEKFASIASHDLKEPLRTIRNYAQIISYSNKQNLDDTGKELLDHIQNSSLRMTELVNDILDFSRVGNEKKELEKFDFNKLVAIVLKDLKILITTKKASISINKLPTLDIDEIQIRQVFQNIISNAIKFVKNKNPQINIEAKELKNYWEFSIKDNGIGIPEEEQKNIFEIFKRLHNRKDYSGQGIGLSICKRIIERHNGKIWVESIIGEGTTFYFTIPK